MAGPLLLLMTVSETSVTLQMHCSIGSRCFVRVKNRPQRLHWTSSTSVSISEVGCIDRPSGEKLLPHMDQAVLRCVSSKVWAFQTFKLHYSLIDYQLCHLVDIKHITKGSINFFRSDRSRLQSLLQVRKDVYLRFRELIV